MLLPSGEVIGTALTIHAAVSTASQITVTSVPRRARPAPHPCRTQPVAIATAAGPADCLLVAARTAWTALRSVCLCHALPRPTPSEDATFDAKQSKQWAAILEASEAEDAAWAIVKAEAALSLQRAREAVKDASSISALPPSSHGALMPPPRVRTKRRHAPALPPEPADCNGDLVLLTLHGFGNRIRSLAGAWCLACELKRRLHVAWAADEACGAHFADLFETRLANGDIVRENTLTASSALAAYSDRSGQAGGGTIPCYEGQDPSRPVELYTSDLALEGLPSNAAEVVAVRGVTCPATLVRNHPAGNSSSSKRGGGGGGGAHGPKTERIHMMEHRSDGKLRGAFYRNLVPAEAVAALMAPTLRRIADACAASCAGASSAESLLPPPPPPSPPPPPRVKLIGVHVRQGDALDLAQRYFFHDVSGGAHSDAFVNAFATEMEKARASARREGQRALFFVASDQVRARAMLRVRFGDCMLELARGARGARPSGDAGRRGRVAALGPLRPAHPQPTVELLR